MARYQMILSYDGTGFAGFQRQAREKNKRTIQEVVEASLRGLGWQDRTILAAGRTDTGVHASGQVIAFDLIWKHGPAELLNAVNAHLPEEIAARWIGQVDPNFHPRYHACSRSYQYRIFCDALRNPLRERYAWRVWPEVDLKILQSAAAQLVGVHDFGAFGSAPYKGGSTIREVFEACWKKDSGGLLFDISANAFLYRMIRRLVAIQVGIAQSKIGLDVLEACLQTGSKQLVKNVAPPGGLCLVEVVYATQSAGNNEPV